MITNREYFTVDLASGITLGLPLSDMGTVAQFDTQDICTIPGVTEHWYGVANFKGSLLWILDSDRFFQLKIEQKKVPTKLTAVVVKDRNGNNNQKAAIVTQQLKGIVALDRPCLKPIPESVPQPLSQCCSHLAQLDEQTIYILDCAALLTQLHQQSMLVSP